MHLFEEKNGEYITVSALNLNQYTLQGWQLVFVYQDTICTPCSETMPAQGQNYGTITVTRYMPATMTMFVLRRPETSALADLNKSLELANQNATNAEGCAKLLREELTKTKKSLDDSKTAALTLETKAEKALRERDTFRATVTKLENDMSKIRTAIGERTIREILDPVPAKV